MEEELLYKNCNLEKLRDASFWKALCPFMSCDEVQVDVQGCIASRLGTEASDQMKERGYFQIRPTQFELETRRKDLIDLLAQAVMKLMQNGWPPIFALMFNEAWELTRIVDAFIGGASMGGESKHVGDFYVFAVLNKADLVKLGTNAFDSCYKPGPPHRDRPTAGPSSFTASLMPHYTSAWVALTDANTSNSCLYCVPKADDTGYFSPGDATDPNLRIDACVAQPLRAGGMLAFSHRLLHWGSALQQWAIEEENPPKLPRIAFTTAFAHSSFEEPYFCHRRFPLDGTTPLDLRLGLVAGQQIQYSHLSPLSKHQLALTRRILHAKRAWLSDTYFDKVSSQCQMLAFVEKMQGGGRKATV